MDEQTLKVILLMIYMIMVPFAILGAAVIAAQTLGKYRPPRRTEHRIRK